MGEMATAEVEEEVEMVKVVPGARTEVTDFPLVVTLVGQARHYSV